jgi:hypothetical protein
MRLGQLAGARDAAKLLRRDVRTIGNPIVVTLRAYEARVTVLRKALNVTGTVPGARAPAGTAHRQSGNEVRSPPVRPRPS